MLYKDEKKGAIFLASFFYAEILEKLGLSPGPYGESLNFSYTLTL